MKSKVIRREFIEFFKKKEHIEVKSSPVVPIDDPTLLFTNAGMNQFKEVFLGKKRAKYSRVVNSQKCIRAGGKHNDLDEVGKDVLHHTFFEMLGNWSFGDYYKKEAIKWAWELLTDKWSLDKTKLYATVHHSDDESFHLWKSETDIEQNHIQRHGDKDNFWEMGETGPCGPCSEIHIDLGEELCNKQSIEGHKCQVNGDCNRFIELWNLVFIQYNRDEEGKLENLASQYVDTGAGFERLCMVLQGKKSNYETDLFVPIIKKIEELAADNLDNPAIIRDKSISETKRLEADPYLVVADHIRALCVALADGGYPSNEGRGYVLRRILRRAARYGRLIGLKKPFLHLLVDVVSQILGENFPEIKEKKGYLKTIIKAEEERFNLTLDKGLVKFEEIVNESTDEILAGKDVFLLYDTYGFPPDLTALLAAERGKMIDEKGFKSEMEKQRQMARDSSSFKMEKSNDDWIILNDEAETKFVGYETPQTECRIIKYTLLDAERFKLVLDRTPFYAESGGQVADTGYIFNVNGKIEITDVKKEGDFPVHYGKIVSGLIAKEVYTAMIDNEYRLSIERNHTVTHLLHGVLKEVLGEHIQQKGSLVAADHLRFDFSHFKGLTKRELNIIEDMVNGRIKEALPLCIEHTTYEDAKAKGAIALFGEKYEEDVRTVSIGDKSLELCGGTHLRNTGEAGLFKIISESAVAAGIRRIEAVTGCFAEIYVRKLQEKMNDLAETLNVPVNQVFDKVVRLTEELHKLNKELESIKLKSANSELDELIRNRSEVEGISVIKGMINAADNNALRNIGDSLRHKIKSGIGVLGAVIDGKAALLAVVTDDLKGKLKAGKIVSKIAEIVDGKGGGRDDMAMAGGKNPDKLEIALQEVETIVKGMLQ